MNKVWVEISKLAAKNNFYAIKSIIKSKTKLWAVVKSNAYGHGLALFASLMEGLGIDGFCVDSVTEGHKLREIGLRKPILVLGPTLPQNFFSEAVADQITLTLADLESLYRLKKSKLKPDFHIKIDTGMHRQGFYLENLKRALQFIKSNNLPLKGAYTHFASAKDINYPTFTDVQFNVFQKAVKILESQGFKNLLIHASATGGAMMNEKYNLGAVRSGIGLYGLYPSNELEAQLGKKLKLKPVLSWHALISEIKNMKAGDYVGYDLTERIIENGKIAIIPIGYWHGFGRGLSGIGEVLINGKRAKVLGRVSMDIIVVNATGIKCKVGDKATLIGRQKSAEIKASEQASKLNTNHYEIITRINPLTERILAN